MPVCVRTRTGRHRVYRRLGKNMMRAQFIVPLQKIIEIWKLKFTKRNNYISFFKKNPKMKGGEIKWQ